VKWRYYVKHCDSLGFALLTPNIASCAEPPFSLSSQRWLSSFGLRQVMGVSSLQWTLAWTVPAALITPL
jgi:hypothetical protein